jgi:hypothetical protein
MSNDKIQREDSDEASRANGERTESVIESPRKVGERKEGERARAAEEDRLLTDEDEARFELPR